MDGVGFPICTDGDFSCLGFQILHHGLWPEQIIGNAIQKIFWFRIHLLASTCEVIAAFHTGHGRKEIPSTPPCPEEEVMRIGEQIKCKYCGVFTLSGVGE